MRWEKNQPPSTGSFFFKQDLNVGYFMLIATYNLLSCELNFTNTKASENFFLRENTLGSREQRAPYVFLGSVTVHGH